MISNTISKKVISIYDGRFLGTVKNVRFNNNFSRVLGYVIFDDDSSYDFFLPYRDVFSESESALMVKNNSKVVAFSEGEPCYNPIGLEVVDVGGNSLGFVKDVLEEKGVCLKLMLSNIEIMASDVVSVGNLVVVKSESVTAKFSPAKKKINEYKGRLPKVKVMASEIKLQKEVTIPPRISSGAEQILGRTSAKTILGYNNELIIYAGEVITEQVIKKAKRHNKLNQLIFHAKS